MDGDDFKNSSYSVDTSTPGVDMNRALCLAFFVACTPQPGSEPKEVDATPDPTTPAGTTPDPTTPDPTTPAGTTPVPCLPPPLLSLADIPEVSSLGDNNYQAVFEVSGDDLVGKFVRDEAAAQGAMLLWQELVMRIPLNQRTQLVQFSLIENDDLAGYVNNTGTDNQTGRLGPSLYLNVSNIADNDPDVCAPLSGRRGTYDWTLIHEFGHLRQYADGTVNDFTATFQTPTGDGEGYPSDGSPVLDGNFVTSYAEEAGGDEDAAESFTTFVMLADIPTNDSIAADKVRFFDEQPDYAELRTALRITEPGGGGDVPPAPLVEFGLEVYNPEWLLGTWQGAGPYGPVEYVFEEDNLIFRSTVAGVTEEVSYADLGQDGVLATVRVVESSEAFHLFQVSIGASGYSETFELQGEIVLVTREHFGTFTITRAEQ